MEYYYSLLIYIIPISIIGYFIGLKIKHTISQFNDNLHSSIPNFYLQKPKTVNELLVCEKNYHQHIDLITQIEQDANKKFLKKVPIFIDETDWEKKLGFYEWHFDVNKKGNSFFSDTIKTVLPPDKLAKILIDIGKIIKKHTKEGLNNVLEEIKNSVNENWENNIYINEDLKNQLIHEIDNYSDMDDLYEKYKFIYRILHNHKIGIGNASEIIISDSIDLEKIKEGILDIKSIESDHIIKDINDYLHDAFSEGPGFHFPFVKLAKSMSSNSQNYFNNDLEFDEAINNIAEDVITSSVGKALGGFLGFTIAGPIGGYFGALIVTNVFDRLLKADRIEEIKEKINDLKQTVIEQQKEIFFQFKRSTENINALIDSLNNDYKFILISKPNTYSIEYQEIIRKLLHSYLQGIDSKLLKLEPLKSNILYLIPEFRKKIKFHITYLTEFKNIILSIDEKSRHAIKSIMKLPLLIDGSTDGMLKSSVVDISVFNSVISPNTQLWKNKIIEFQKYANNKKTDKYEEEFKSINSKKHSAKEKIKHEKKLLESLSKKKNINLKKLLKKEGVRIDISN